MYFTWSGYSDQSSTSVGDQGQKGSSCGSWVWSHRLASWSVSTLSGQDVSLSEESQGLSTEKKQIMDMENKLSVSNTYICWEYKKYANVLTVEKQYLKG